ncbi:MAG: ParA family protein [Nostoc sp. CreGUA01]|nr:ParA family protein [Nostoc sp. CreGUA01]
MTKIISIFNNKGGVGKTTILWNLADAIARKEKRVLMIDFDPQCNLSLAVLYQFTLKLHRKELQE